MLKKLFSSQLRINATSGVVTVVINSIVLMMAYPIYLHFLGYEEYGVWLILTAVLTFGQLGNLGIDRAMMKLVAEEYGRGNIEAIQKYLVAAISVLMLTGGLVLLLVFAFRIQIAQLFKLSGENQQMVLLLLPYVGCLSVYAFVAQAFTAVLSGLGRMDLANYTQTAGRLLKLSVAGALLYGGRGIESLLIANAVSYALIHLVSFVLIRRIVTVQLLRMCNFRMECYLRLLAFGVPLVSGSMLSMLVSPFNKLMLSRYVGVAAVPIYDIAYNGSMQVRGMIEAGLRALMPEISRVGANITIQARERISQLNARAMRLIFLLGAPAYAALIVFASLLLRLWLGAKFVDVLPGVLRIMLVGTFLSLLCVPAYFTLMGLGRIRQCFLSHVIQGLVNTGVVGVSLLLVGTLSIWSIASAVVLAMGATSFYTIWQSRHAMQRFHFGATRKGPESVTGVIVSPACHANLGHDPGAEQDADASETLRLRPPIAERGI